MASSHSNMTPNQCEQYAPAAPDSQTAARFDRRCHRRYVAFIGGTQNRKSAIID